jgi:IS30 family transposase
VSHETIYRSLFVQAKGALKHELTGYLRTRRVMRRPRGANKYRGNGMGQLRDIVSIRERPAEAEDRAVPGHWEGDLIRGTGASAVGTLVERSSRLLMLFKVDKVDAETVAAALRAHILTLPEQLRRSLTWDQGKEMGRHAQFTIDTGVQVYFCDPRVHGSAAPTRTPTAWCASTCPSAPTSSPTARQTSTPSRSNSTDVLARPSTS